MSTKPKIELRYKCDKWDHGILEGSVEVEAEGDFNHVCEIAKTMTTSLCGLASKMAQDVIVREHKHENKRGADAFAVHLVMEGLRDFVNTCGTDPDLLFAALIHAKEKEMEDHDEELSALN